MIIPKSIKRTNSYQNQTKASDLKDTIWSVLKKCTFWSFWNNGKGMKLTPSKKRTVFNFLSTCINFFGSFGRIQGHVLSSERFVVRFT